MTAVKEMSNWDVNKIREDFPVLSQTVNGKPLVYLDNSGSSQVPNLVIERGSKYLAEEHSNIHRGVHYLSQRATTALSMPKKPKNVSSCAAAPKALISWHIPTGASLSAKATKSSFPRWSITPTLFRGRSWRKKKALSCALSR